jgi:alkylated DNA nucleotide flippase Atl1
MLVPTPLLVAEEVRKVRKGRVVTPRDLRQRLAARNGADSTCPMTTGIFLSIIAGAAEEQLAAGKRPVAPYWRVVGEDGRLNPKWPPGPARQAERLRREGHQISFRKAKGSWVFVRGPGKGAAP